MDPGSISSSRLAGSVPQDQMTCSDFCGSEYSCGQYEHIEANTYLCVHILYLYNFLVDACNLLCLTNSYANES